MGDYTNQGYITSDFGTVTPMASTVDAQDATISEACESQMERGEINVVVMFSLLSLHHLKQTKASIVEDGLTENLSLFFSQSELYGGAVNYNKKKFITIDCSHLQYDPISGKVITLGEMMSCLEAGVGEIKQYLYEEISGYTGGTVHFQIASFESIEQLAYSLSSLLGNDLPDDDGHYQFFTDIAKEMFSFSEFKGWRMDVKYVCLYHVFNFYFVRKLYANEIRQIMAYVEKSKGYYVRHDMIPEHEVVVYLDPIAIDYGHLHCTYGDLRAYLPVRRREEALLVEYEAALRHAAAVERGEEEAKFYKTPLEVAHDVLGITSIAFSLLSLADGGLHVYEAVETDDPELRKQHLISAGIDVLCCIPFVKLFKVAKECTLGAKIWRATATTAKTGGAFLKHGVQVVKYGGKKIVLKTKISLNSLANKGVSKVSRYTEEVGNKAKKEFEELGENNLDEILASVKGQVKSQAKMRSEAAYIAMATDDIIQRDGAKFFLDLSKGIFKKNVANQKLLEQLKRLKSIQPWLEKMGVKFGEKGNELQFSMELLKEEEAAAKLVAETVGKANLNLTKKAFSKLFGDDLLKKAGKAFVDPVPLSRTFRNTYKALKGDSEKKVGGALFKEIFKQPEVWETGVKDLYTIISVATSTTNQKVNYGSISADTGIPEELVEVALEDGSKFLTTEQALELEAIIQQIRADYGYAPDEDKFHIDESIDEPDKRHETQNPIEGYHINSPLDIFKK